MAEELRYESNSHKSREAREKAEKIQPVASGRVKKRSEARKFADVFLSEDAESVKSYIFMDVLVPAIKKAISDVVTNGIDMLLYGESGKAKRNSNASRVSYSQYYNNSERRYDRPARTRAAYNYDDILLDTRAEAEDVLARMDELMDTYGLVSVADLYDLVGVTGNYTDNNYGWTDIRSASVVRTRDGYIIKMPRALPLN